MDWIDRSFFVGLFIGWIVSSVMLLVAMSLIRASSEEGRDK